MNGGLERRSLLAAVLAAVLAATACAAPGPLPPTSPSAAPPSGSAASPPSTLGPTPPPTPTLEPSPTLGPPSPTAARPTDLPSSTPAPLAPGVVAYVSVAVATGWRSPGLARAVDAPALANPVRLRAWLGAMDLREQADLIGRADTQVLLGDELIVVRVDGSWVRVTVPAQPTPLDERGYPAWIPARQLTTVGPVAAERTATVVQPTAWLVGPGGDPVIEVAFGTRLPVLEIEPTRTAVAVPGGERLWVASGAVEVGRTGAAPRSPDADSIVRTARRFVGLRYLWAGTSGFGFDCSGLVYSVYRVHGIDLPRDSAPQSTVGRPVARSDLRRGDLVFFGAAKQVRHVAIYVGSGRIIEAPDVGKPVREIDLAPDAAVVVARRVVP